MGWVAQNHAGDGEQNVSVSLAFACSSAASIEWCRWAGVRRIFHWDDVRQTFLCVKVNESVGGSHRNQANISSLACMVHPVSHLWSFTTD
jgi:hypothetical protein